MIARETLIGSVPCYPILTRLEAVGWLTSEWEQIDPKEASRPRQRFYRLTGLVNRNGHRRTEPSLYSNGGLGMDFLTNVLGSLLAALLYDASPELAALLIKIAARVLPGNERALKEEEWLAHLHHCESKPAKISHALGCLRERCDDLSFPRCRSRSNRCILRSLLRSITSQTHGPRLQEREGKSSDGANGGIRIYCCVQ